MDISPSTPAANGQVLAKIFAQARIGDPNDPVPGEQTPKAVSSSLLPHPQSELGLHDGEMRAESPNTDERATEPMESEDDSDDEDETTTDIMNKVVLVWGDFWSVIQHVGIVARLDLWKVVIEQKTLEDWAAQKPTWEDISSLAETIVKEHVAPADIDAVRNQEEDERDLVKENMMLFHRQALLYEETSYAMNHGDIGRLEKNFLPWINTFAGCGKHKYAAELKRYLENVQFRYPERLSRAIRLNILCNPTGKPDHFRALDWVIELNILYIKHIHGGQFSNRTVERIIKESPLIEIYKSICQQFEDMFCLEHRTSHYTPANMKNTFAKLAEYMRKEETSVFITGRKADHEVQDTVAVGCHKLLEGEVDLDVVDQSEDTSGIEIEVDDDGSLFV
ncbi:hypothetical protein NP233_g92 [Leucocoprinus birnbaumii]|uniref:DUF6589 domain-containing protein n=1 Tax=Leucocoprinus birnbaumii TaxID=56174 RepID=A0AAD5W4U3_9AGAR|nr:hypothetical protein NP233_g92 [Leucocoprinus birnbaumii]